MLNLDKLGAVSVDKGCYPGQEIVARTHFRGASKRRLFRLNAAAAVAEGADIHDDSGKIGTVVNAIDGEVLAVCHRDRLGGPIRVGETELRLP